MRRTNKELDSESQFDLAYARRNPTIRIISDTHRDP